MSAKSSIGRDPECAYDVDVAFPTEKILQLNLHKSKAAEALLPNGQWIDDDTGTAANWIPIIFVNPPKSHGKCFVWVQCENTTAISSYLIPSDCIKDLQDKLNETDDKIMDIVGHFIVAGDFNSGT